MSHDDSGDVYRIEGEILPSWSEADKVASHVHCLTVGLSRSCDTLLELTYH